MFIWTTCLTAACLISCFSYINNYQWRSSWGLHNWVGKVDVHPKYCMSPGSYGSTAFLNPCLQKPYICCPWLSLLILAFATQHVGTSSGLCLQSIYVFIMIYLLLLQKKLWLKMRSGDCWISGRYLLSTWIHDLISSINHKKMTHWLFMIAYNRRYFIWSPQWNLNLFFNRY